MHYMSKHISERECALLVSCRANEMVIGSNSANYNFSTTEGYTPAALAACVRNNPVRKQDTQFIVI